MKHIKAFEEKYLGHPNHQYFGQPDYKVGDNVVVIKAYNADEKYNPIIKEGEPCTVVKAINYFYVVIKNNDGAIEEYHKNRLTTKEVWDANKYNL